MSQKQEWMKPRSDSELPTRRTFGSYISADTIDYHWQAS